jgi:sortase A
MRGELPLRRALEWTFLAIAIGCLGWYGWSMVRIHERQRRADLTVERALSDVHSGPDLDLPSQPDGFIGRLEIPRLHISAVVQQGEGDEVLDYAVGYLPDTPKPWLPGNSALAAHRDRLFRPLEHVRVGDDIRLSTTHGDFLYRVIQTLIVNPNDVWVLEPIPHVNLTLVTCYPFRYVGHAPRRFIVQAEKVIEASSPATARR